ncbi:MAG: hypothetical protein K2L62_01340 [Muribaculaceae bacterium]|nr:hypothetical protein [Muribaculaceae bacterium]
MWLTSSSIGRKLIMSLTGAFLILFVTFHALMNGVAMFWPAAYNVICEFLGANWYALVGTLVLAAGFILHIIYATWLTLQNRKARGNERYAVTTTPKQVEWSSKNMLVLGIVVLAFLVIHMIQFWSKMQLAEILHCEATDCATGEAVPAAAGTWFLEIAFRHWYTPVIYIIGFVALWFHMTHGFWSMMQTVGWNNDTWMNRLKCIGNWWATIVVALFIAEAIVFTVNANRQTYTSCPALQAQYAAMVEEGKDAFIEGSCAAQECAAEACGAQNPACNAEVCGDTCGKTCSDACVEANCAQGQCVNESCGNPACAPQNVTVTETTVQE